MYKKAKSLTSHFLTLDSTPYQFQDHPQKTLYFDPYTASDLHVLSHTLIYTTIFNMADQDLDDELLALAGGGSPEEATGDVKQSIESPGGLQRPSPHTNASNSHSFNTNGTSKLRGGEVEASQA